jgi:hypothetical protein
LKQQTLLVSRKISQSPLFSAQVIVFICFFFPARQDYPNKAINQLYIVAVPLKSSAVSQPKLPPVRPKMRLSRSGFRLRIDASAVAVSKIAGPLLAIRNMSETKDRTVQRKIFTSLRRDDR